MVEVLCLLRYSLLFPAKSSNCLPIKGYQDSRMTLLIIFAASLGIPSSENLGMSSSKTTRAKYLSSNCQRKKGSGAQHIEKVLNKVNREIDSHRSVTVKVKHRKIFEINQTRLPPTTLSKLLISCNLCTMPIQCNPNRNSVMTRHTPPRIIEDFGGIMDVAYFFAPPADSAAFFASA
jgi:hypothetical protein